MKRYFEYEFNNEVKERLVQYYENTKLDQHNENHFLKSKQKLARIKEAVAFQKEDTVLDIGCSSGFLLQTLSPEIKSGLGIDVSSNIITQNRANNKCANINFAHFSGTEIGGEESFSKILLIDVLEHAFYPDVLLSSLYKKMGVGAELIVEVPFTGFLSELFFGAYHQGHLRYYDPYYLADYLTKCGFVIESVRVYNSVPFASVFIKYPKLFSLLDSMVNILPSAMYPYFGEIIVVAKKKE